MTANRYKVSFCGDKNVLEPDRDGSYTHCECTKGH